MNLYLDPHGFLGTGASLLADLTLLAYVLLIVPGMVAGFVFARQGRHRPHHKWVMIGVTGINWVLIGFLMLAAFTFDVAGNFKDQPGNVRYLLPAVHGLLGLPAQLLATFIVVRMLVEDWQVARAKKRGESDLQKYWFKGAKWTMQVTLWLWLATAALGIVIYLVRYEAIPPTRPAGVAAPIATEDVRGPVETPELQVTATEDAQPTDAAPEEPPAATEDIH